MNKFISAIAAMMLTVALFAVLLYGIMHKPYMTLAEGAQKEIYLTFDDGPSDGVTPKILDVLKKENVPATFFIVGERAEKRKEILKRIYDEGHTLAVHSHSHIYKEIYSSCEALILDIERCNEIICSVTGEYSKVYRFPGGSFSLSPEIISAVTKKGYEYVDWNASFCDSEIKDVTAGKLYTAALSTVVNPNRIVMLAHDGADKTQTVEALKEVIRHFKHLGYEFKKF